MRVEIEAASGPVDCIVCVYRLAVKTQMNRYPKRRRVTEISSHSSEI